MNKNIKTFLFIFLVYLGTVFYTIAAYYHLYKEFVCFLLILAAFFLTTVIR
jgi:hypothetical protein